MDEYKRSVSIPVTRLKAVMDGAPVSQAFFLDFLAGLIEAGVFASESVDSVELGIAVGRLITLGKVSDGADFAVMTQALYTLDPAPVFQ